MGGKHAVARDDDRDGVALHGATDGLGRHAPAAAPEHHKVRELPIAREPAVRHVEQKRPHLALKARAPRGQGQLARIGALAGKVALEPPQGPGKHRLVRALGRVGLHERVMPRLPVEGASDERTSLRSQNDIAERGFDMGCVSHCRQSSIQQNPEVL